ncbi:coiled-coil domain-containing protein 28B isoform X5 [Penaeus vannamei]|uniref:coiled-coil domain-containing protein 28B isoform X5 n=1 Tax=Penaeus vannamei TaxID=6689 RepID=UPI00387FB0B2
MSKKIEDSELQTLTLSPTNTNDDECSPFVNLASDETSFPISPPQSYSTVTTSSTVTKDEKRKVERLISAPVNSVKVAPNLRVSTPPGSTRITYSNERSNERKIDLSKISRDRPTPGNTLSQKKDVADVRQIEQGLLQLMEDFQAGNLRAFGKDSRLRQMEAIREQQERLARLHFEVGAEQDLYPPLSEEGLRTSHDNMRTLMEKLAQLSESIERLHTNTSSDRKTSSSERKAGVHQMGGGQMNSRTNEHANHTNFHSGGTAAHQTYENQHRPNNPTGTPSRNSGGNPMPHSFSTNVTNSSIHQSSPGNPRPLSGQHRSRNTPVHHTGLVKNGTVLESS